MMDLFVGVVCLAIVAAAVYIMINKKETPADVVKEIDRAVAFPVDEKKEEVVVKPKKPRAPKKPASPVSPTAPIAPKKPRATRKKKAE